MLASHSVVVCVHNALDDLKRCYRSLKENRDSLYEIIFVDDFSAPETKVYLEEVDRNDDLVKLIRTNNRVGYTKAANIGVRLSQGSVVTMLNSDTIVPSRWSMKVIGVAEGNPELGVFGPLSNAASYQSVPDIKGSTGQTAINPLPSGVSVDQLDEFCEEVSSGMYVPFVPLVHGFCMSITRRCLDVVGQFDEEAFPLGYGEENDFCLRSADAGFALGIAVNTYVYHAKSKSYGADERVSLMNQGWEALVAKHGRRRLSRSIKIMEAQPILVKVRNQVAGSFDWQSAVEAPSEPVVLQEQPRDGLVAQASQATDITVIAFYLPQYHPLKFNDEAWGEGFTEWNNVVRARPRFPGHVQPKYPGKLGFYDLRLPDVMNEQAKLGRAHGISGFCMYYYRLGGRRLMTTPSGNLLQNKSIDMQFCYCWANESWTRAWDGKSSDVLLKQEYDDSTFWGLVDDLAQASEDGRYIRINNRPIFLIYQASEIPTLSEWMERLRSALKCRTGEAFLIGSVYSVNFRKEMLDHLDFVVQFPPHRIPRIGRRVTIKPEVVEPFEPERGDYYEAYDDVVDSSLLCSDAFEPLLLGVCPDWDNTSRRKSNAHTIIGSTPEKFEGWVRKAAQMTRVKHGRGAIPDKILFVNAWNEWAEGAVLEPSEASGYAYLEALRDGLTL
jgi:GT2 family glycosyltransferase